MITRIAGSLLLLLALSAVAESAELAGRVVGVTDGDSLTLLVNGLEQVKVRLAEIDAPEHDQPFGQRSKQSLSELIYNRLVTVKVWDRDDYGRTVGVVWIGDRNVDAEQVRRGMAWVYRQFAKTGDLYRLEAEAKQARRGLWADVAPVPPWEWRHGGHEGVVERPDPPRPAMALTCGSKRRCVEMANCEEARYFLVVCGVKSLDGDGDGQPCNSLCR